MLSKFFTEEPLKPDHAGVLTSVAQCIIAWADYHLNKDTKDSKMTTQRTAFTEGGLLTASLPLQLTADMGPLKKGGHHSCEVPGPKVHLILVTSSLRWGCTLGYRELPDVLLKQGLPLKEVICSSVLTPPSPRESYSTFIIVHSFFCSSGGFILRDGRRILV